jgi:lantibiotic biosynthesis protein
MKKQIITKLREINNILADKQEQSNEDEGLLGGSAGDFLFLLIYAFLCAEDQIERNTTLFQKFLERLQNKVIAESSYTSGLLGIGWFLDYLQKLEVLDDSIGNLLKDIDNIALKNLSKNLENNQTDFLYGAVGDLFYLLERGLINEEILQEYIDNLVLLGVQNEESIFWIDTDFVAIDKEEKTVNMGLAHGMPSKIKLYNILTEKNINIGKNKPILEKSINFLFSKQNQTGYFTTFPNVAFLDKRSDYNSRLAWCYGDLSIAKVLLHTSQITEDEELKKKALDIAFATVKRKETDHTSIDDACICHGSSGIALIYHLLFNETNIKEFETATNYWINDTLNRAFHKDGLAGYRSYLRSDTPQWVNETGLLEGVAGIGLVLLTYLNPKTPDWYRCLLL